MATSSSHKFKLNTVAVKLGCNRRFHFRSWSKQSKKQPSKKYSLEEEKVDDGSWVAVEKVSEDPYLDFRNSMLRIVMEKRMYAEDDLRKMLECFMKLNSVEFHDVIFKAFVEVLDWCLHFVSK